MGNIDLVALHIFKTVAEEGGITKAAAKLHRVQSNVTTRVKQLEAKLGTNLFLRRRRGLLLSPEGRLLLAYADQLLRLSSEAENLVRAGAPRGTLRIGTMESTAASRLPPLLSRYHSAYPEVRLELVTGTSGALVAKVLDYEVEAAFVAEPTIDKSLESQPAFSEDLVLIAPRTFPAIRTGKDIGRSTVIAFGAGCAYRRRLEDWLRRVKAAPERVMEFGSYHTIVACVAGGAGIAVVPRSVIGAVLADKQVAIYPLPADIARAKTRLVWRRGHRSSALDAMRKELARVAPAIHRRRAPE
ncbi:MAG TPA: LysR substrate-binding domain-containing protein [Burkholderiales bacterium]|nr:LysR substrate-binding domain-containing protein [Burkholderiales bacterium]